MNEKRPSWTEGSFGDSLTIEFDYRAGGTQPPDKVSLRPLRSIPAVMLYTEQGNWARMNPTDLATLGYTLIEAAAAYGVTSDPRPEGVSA